MASLDIYYHLSFQLMSIISCTSVWLRNCNRECLGRINQAVKRHDGSQTASSLSLFPLSPLKPRGCVSRSIPRRGGDHVVVRADCSRNVTRVLARFVRPAGMRSVCGRDVVSRPRRVCVPYRPRESATYLARRQLSLIKREKRQSACEKVSASD